MKESLTTIAAFLGASAFLVTFLFVPVVMRLARWVGAVDRGGYRRSERGDIPLLGGLAIAAPFLLLAAAASLAQALPAEVRGLMGRALMNATGLALSMDAIRHHFAPLAAGSSIILLLGMADDVYGLKARSKLPIQILAALCLCAGGQVIRYVSIPLVGGIMVEGGLGWGLTVLWVVGLTNAFNILDGIDGLATGVALIAALAFAFLASLTGNLFVALLGCTLAGSLLAFLRYNFPPGRVFLGNAGSMFLGFVLSAIALMGAHKEQAAALMVAPVLVLGLPILETLISMARRYARGQPLFAGDNRHTHHRLFKRGLSGRRTLLFLYGVSAIFAIGSIWREAAPRREVLAPIGWAAYAIGILAIVWAGGYIPGPRTVLARLARRGENRLLGDLARYASRALSMNNGLEHMQDILRLVRKHARLQCIDVLIEEGPAFSDPPASGDGSSRGAAVPVREETVLVRSPGAKTVSIRFGFDRIPGNLEVEDIAGCLARIFEQAEIREPASVATVQKSEILGVGCNLMDYHAVLDTINAWRRDGHRGCRYVIAINPHSVMLSRRNRTVLQAMAGAALAVPDGTGMIWAANILGYSHRGRVTGPTLMLNLCDWGRQHGLRHFFYGGKRGVADVLVKRLTELYPGLQPAGTHSPPFRELTPEEDAAQCRMINDAKPDIVWVGLGAPKQEQWMAAHKDRLRVPVMIGVGAAFDFHSGNVKWAPAWIRAIGCEWAYRLVLEPRRMWRRNLDSPLFLLSVAAERLKPPAFRKR